jgi:ribonuclease-3
LLRNVEINPEMPAISKDAKTELQEWLQGRKMALPQSTVWSATHRRCPQADL